MGAAARQRAAERQRLARAWDDASDGDRAWFAANPLRTTRIRHTTTTELETNVHELRRSMTPGAGRRWFTLVRQVGNYPRGRMELAASEGWRRGATRACAS